MRGLALNGMREDPYAAFSAVFSGRAIKSGGK
jgi:hypothetical protein